MNCYNRTLSTDLDSAIIECPECQKRDEAAAFWAAKEEESKIILQRLILERYAND